MHTDPLLTPETLRWHALLAEAEAAAGDCLPRELAFYVVSMLMRFIGRPERLAARHGPSQLRRITRRRVEGDATLAEVGDQCLIFAGLFPQEAQARGVALAWFVERGRRAWRAHAEESGQGIYDRLADAFVPLMDLLQTMRELDDGRPCLDRLAAWQLWQETGSAHAWRTLLAGGRSLPAPAPPPVLH